MSRKRRLLSLCVGLGTCAVVWLILSLKTINNPVLNLDLVHDKLNVRDGKPKQPFQKDNPVAILPNSAHDGRNRNSNQISVSGVDIGCTEQEKMDNDLKCYVYSYCNSPHIPVKGDEGEVPSGYTLRQVHVFIRHGDRTPVHTVPGHVPEKLNCNFSSWYTGADENIRNFPAHLDTMAVPARFAGKWLYPKISPCESSTLTSRGALQHILLGRHLRTAYMNKHPLISMQNPYGSQLFLKSTFYTRTAQSAIALLYGFIPNLDVPKLFLDFSKSTSFCSTSFPNITSCSCKHADKIKHSKGSSRSERSKILIDTVADIFGKPILDNPYITAISDSLTPGFCHSKPKPCRKIEGPNNVSQNEDVNCVTMQLMGQIWEEVTTHLKSQTTKDDIQAATLKLYPVLYEIATRLRNLAQSKFSPRFILYSGHDVTITPLLTVLGLHDGRWPPYASRLVIETLEYQNTKEFYLKFLYNGVDLTKEVKFCKSSRLRDGLCPLDSFVNFIFNDCLQEFGYNNYKDACGS